jgi:hypothetical protein
MSAYGSCSSCSAAIIWATTVDRKKMPLDRQDDPAGIVLAYQDHLGTFHCRAYIPGEAFAPPWKRYTSHFATCPKADEHRKPKDADGQRAAAQDVVTYLHEYRKEHTS